MGIAIENISVEKMFLGNVRVNRAALHDTYLFIPLDPMVTPENTGGINYGYTEGGVGSISKNPVENTYIRGIQSFGANWNRLDLGVDGLQQLSTRPYVRWAGHDNVWYLLQSTLGNGYSYGGSVPGIAAYLQSRAGLATQFEISATAY
jgi:hypothetical protein